VLERRSRHFMKTKKILPLALLACLCAGHARAQLKAGPLRADMYASAAKPQIRLRVEFANARLKLALNGVPLLDSDRIPGSSAGFVVNYWINSGTNTLAVELAPKSAAQAESPSMSIDLRYHGEKYGSAQPLVSYSYPPKDAKPGAAPPEKIDFTVSAGGFERHIWERAQQVSPDEAEKAKMSAAVFGICRAFAAHDAGAVLALAKVRDRAMADSLGLRPETFESGFGVSLQQLLRDRLMRVKPCSPYGMRFVPLEGGRLFRALDAQGADPVEAASGEGMRASYEIYISRFLDKWVWVR